DECAGNVTAFSCDLVAAGAVVGEELQHTRETSTLRVRRRNRRTAAEPRDVADQRAQLELREEHARRRGLLADARERHRTGAQVEVGCERAGALQLRPLVPLAVRPVALRTIGG